MGIMDMFRNVAQPANIAPQQTQQQAMPQPGNLPAQQSQIAAQSPDGQVPGVAPANEQPSPFAEFGKLWETPKLPDGQQPDAPIQFNIDAAKVQQSARNIDFTKTVTPALLEQIKGGGEGAMTAMLSAMNEMAQTVFAQSMMANTKVLESSLETSHQRTVKSLPGTIRKETIGQALREDNPLFSNPATAPMLQMLENQLVAQFPSATPAQIKEHARNYLAGFAGEVGKLTPATPEQTSARGREIDWSQIPV